jgi:hypothetical protein
MYLKIDEDPTKIIIPETNKYKNKTPIRDSILELNTEKTDILNSFSTKDILAKKLKIGKERMKRIIHNNEQYDEKYYLEYNKCPQELLNKYEEGSVKNKPEVLAEIDRRDKERQQNQTQVTTQNQTQVTTQNPDGSSRVLQTHEIIQALQNITNDCLEQKKQNEILVSFDATQLNQNSFQLLQQLPNIIKDNGEIGSFELDIFKVTINSLTEYQNDLIVCKN